MNQKKDHSYLGSKIQKWK